MKCWGPSVRNVIKLETNQLTAKDLYASATAAAETFIAHPEEVAQSVVGYGRDFSHVPHSLFTIRPRALDAEGRSGAVPHILTDNLLAIFTSAIARASAVRRSILFGFLTSHTWTRPIYGHVYESFMHARIAAHPTSPALIAVSDDAIPLEIPVCKIVPLNSISNLRSANKHQVPFCWRPTSDSWTTIDCIVCTVWNVIFISATIRDHHDAKIRGITDVLDNLPATFLRNRKLHFVWVTAKEMVGLGDPQLAKVGGDGGTDIGNFFESSDISTGLFSLSR